MDTKWYEVWDDVNSASSGLHRVCCDAPERAALIRMSALHFSRPEILSANISVRLVGDWPVEKFACRWREAEAVIEAAK